MRNVLVAVDDDHFGNLIADFLVDYKWKDDTNFRILSVIPWLPPESQVRVSSDLQIFVESTTNQRWSLLQNFMDRLEAQRMSIEPKFELEVLTGNPAELLLKTAESWPADLIIVGSHSRKGLNLFFMGSVSSAIVNHAPCSVMVVRPQQSVANKSNEVLQKAIC